VNSKALLTGEVLLLIGQQSGYEQVRRARMTNDVLIAMSVARNGFVVLTKNPQDFEQIAKFRAFRWERVWIILRFPGPSGNYQNAPSSGGHRKAPADARRDDEGCCFIPGAGGGPWRDNQGRRGEPPLL